MWRIGAKMSRNKICMKGGWWWWWWWCLSPASAFPEVLLVFFCLCGVLAGLSCFRTCYIYVTVTHLHVHPCMHCIASCFFFVIPFHARASRRTEAMRRRNYVLDAHAASNESEGEIDVSNGCKSNTVDLNNNRKSLQIIRRNATWRGHWLALRPYCNMCLIYTYTYIYIHTYIYTHIYIYICL